MGTTIRKTASPGDLLEVETPKGFSYVQYVGKHPAYGDVIHVFGGLFEETLADFTALIGKSGYLAFYSARASVKQGLTKVVGHSSLSTEVPRNTRRAGARARTGEVLTWIIDCGGEEFVPKQLSDADRQLPIVAIWDHGLLVVRITEGWSPEKEG